MGIDRKQVDGDRYYYNDDFEVMSVTTILSRLEEDDTGLKIWKRINNGQGDNAHWEHLFWYKTYRGTLCHYQALSLYVDDFDSEDSMWGAGEKEALEMMTFGPKPGTFRYASHSPQDVVYSILYDQGTVQSRKEFYAHYSDVTLLDVVTADQRWFLETFKEIIDVIGVGTILNVEKFLIQEGLGYGGQVDMLYEDVNGNIVVADLKTSSGLRQKHALQSVAYARAIEQSTDIDVDSIDRIEIIRLHPDTKTWQIHSDKDATEYHDTESFFKDKYGNWEYKSVEHMWKTFCDLAISTQNR